MFQIFCLKNNTAASKKKLSIPETKVGIPYIFEIAESESRGAVALLRHISSLTLKNMENRCFNVKHDSRPWKVDMPHFKVVICYVVKVPEYEFGVGLVPSFYIPSLTSKNIFKMTKCMYDLISLWDYIITQCGNMRNACSHDCYLNDVVHGINWFSTNLQFPLRRESHEWNLFCWIESLSEVTS